MLYNYVSFNLKNSHSYLKFNKTADIIKKKKEETVS